MLYEFDEGHNTAEAIKNISCTKSEGAIDHRTVIRWPKKYCLGCKTLDNQTRPGRPKTVDSGAVLQDIEPNLVSST